VTDSPMEGHRQSTCKTQAIPSESFLVYSSTS